MRFCACSRRRRARPTFGSSSGRPASLQPSQASGERLRQPVVVSRFVVALGGDPDQDPVRSRRPSMPPGPANHRWGPGSDRRAPEHVPRPPPRQASRIPGMGSAAMDPSIESGAVDAIPSADGDPVAAVEDQFAVGGHHSRPATIVFVRTPPSRRSPRAATGTPSDPRSRSSRTRRDSGSDR